MEVRDILLQVPIEKYIAQYADDMAFRDGAHWLKERLRFPSVPATTSIRGFIMTFPPASMETF